MKELFALMAGIMPKEELIKMIKENIDDYEIDPSEDNWNTLTMTCMLLGTKRTIDAQSGEGGEKVVNFIEELEKSEKAINLLKPDNN